MRYKFILLCICVQILCVTSAFSQAWDGASTDTDWYFGHESDASYTIWTADELAGLAYLVKENVEDFAGKTINIGDDPSNPLTIDLGGNTWTPIGYWVSKNVIYPFRGSVNGNNCTIKNFRTSGSYRGLFGYVRSNTLSTVGDIDILIRDINVEASVSGSQYVGGLCGYICGYSVDGTYRRNANIKNCTFNGTVNASSSDSYVGGIAGIAYYTVIEECATAGRVSGYSYVGGIVGDAYSTSSTGSYKPIVQNCVNAALISGSNVYVGGIVGYTYYAILRYNVNGGCVFGTSDYSGGILGYSAKSTPLSYCLNGGNVPRGGSISGKGGAVTISYCYYDKQISSNPGYGVVSGDDENYVDVVGRYEGLLTAGITSVIDDFAPSGITGADWSTSRWKFNAGFYPIPLPLASSNFAKVTSATIFMNADDYLPEYVYNPFTATGTDVTWSSSNTDYITIASDGSSSTILPNDHGGRTEISATIGDLSKVIIIDTRDDEALPSPLPIENRDDLKAFRDAINGVAPDYKGAVSYRGFAEYDFEVSADIDLEGESWEPIGNTAHPFCGFFDGAGYTISGLNVSASEAYKGLFGYVQSGSIVNLTVEGNVRGTTYLGGICGILKGSATAHGLIENCHFVGNVTTTSTSSAYVGGVCGYAATCSDITSCSATGSVESPNQRASYMGGIVGYYYGGSNATTQMTNLSNCINLAEVSGNGYIGGIAGYVYRYSNVENNLNAGNVYGKTTTVGGIIGSCANNRVVYVNQNINIATVNSGSSLIGIFADTDYDVAPEHNYYDKQRSVLGGINAADVADQAEGLKTSEIIGISLSGWATSTGCYPLQSDFTYDPVRAIAKAAARFENEEIYNAVATNFYLSPSPSTGVSWTSENDDIVSVSSTYAIVTGELGNATLVASKDGYSKKVLVSVAIDEDPLTISTYEELVMFRDAVNAGLEGSYKGHANDNGFAGVNFKVTADIDMTDDENTWVAIGTSTNPFRGNFDGGSAEGYTISNMTISASGSYTGLFGYVFPTTTSSTIENIELSGTISAKSYSGAVVGYAKGTNSERNVVINNCHFNGSLTASSNVGGICGYAAAFTTISNCTSAGAKIAGSSTSVGGICGYSTGNATTKNVITGCASMSKNLRGTGTVGGIVGYAQNTDVCYNVNAALVTANNSVVGGIAGNVLDGASLNECLNFITVFDIGKIYGTNAGSITDCFYDSKHCVLGTDNGEAKTTAEMMSLVSSLTSGKWTTYTGSYPIPINIASHSSAKVACAPVTLGGTEDNQNVESNYSICTAEGIAWSLTTTPASAAESITISGSDVTVGTTDFSRIVMIASLGGWEKQVTLTNSEFGSQIVISNYNELVEFRTAVNNGSTGEYQGIANIDGFSGTTVKLNSNITITANWTPIGAAANPFKGTFDGQGHTVSNLRHTSSSTPRGLFGYIENATIKNLNVKTGTGSTILKATTYCGGIVGSATKSTIQDCSFNGDITATSTWIGGIVGKMVSSTVRRCVTAGTISSSTSTYVGGICGHASYSDAESVIEDCASNMDISGVSSIGGIAGYISNSKVQRCINAGNISGATNNVGGIVGYETDDMAQVLNNINAGTVYTGGGVVGFKHPDATVTNNYFDNQRSVDMHGIAEVGEDGDPSDAGATGDQTVNLIGTHSLFASGWTEAADRYPVPTAISSLDATKLAAVPVKLGSQNYNLVTANFNVGVMSDLTWGSSDDVYVSINQSTGEATVTTSTYNMSTLTATYQGWKKTAKVFNPSTEDPLPIADVASLKNLRDAVNSGSSGSYMGVPNVGGFTGKNFKLTSASANYDLSGEENWEPIGKSSSYPFNGNFYGAGKNVIGLNVDAPEADNKGLFGYIIGGSINDLNVAGNVSGKSNVGGICGYIKGANSDNYSAINNCTFNGNVTAAASYAGGIAGYNYYYSTIDTCRVAGSVSAATSYAGGITGYSNGNSGSNLNKVSSCTNAATVSCNGDYVGGIAGRNTNSNIEYCNNGGNVTGSRYLTGGITANNSNTASSVLYCISTSLVNEGGAIVGHNQGTATGNFYDKQRTTVKGISTTDGTSADQSGKAVGLLTEAMTGTTPSGLTGDGWIPLRWTFVEGSYPIPTVIAVDDDFAVVTSIPVFLLANWDEVNTTNSPFTLGDQTSTWGNNNTDYISISGTTATVSHPQDLNSAILTPSLNGVSKVIFLCDYSTIPDLNIDNIDDLKAFRDAVNNRGTGTYKGVLNNDGYRGVTFILTPAIIDLTGENWEPIGNTSDKGFSGIFNGNGNEIQNLTITGYENDYAGLFGYVYGGEINDLKLTDVSITTTGSYVGALCGRIAGTTAANYSPISNCEVSGAVSSTGETNYVGGVAGVVGSYANVANCTADVVVNAYSNAGGIVGYVSAVSSSKNIIENCVSKGSVTASNNYAGGIVGYFKNDGIIYGCVNRGAVKALAYAGGIAGRMDGADSENLFCIVDSCRNDNTVNATASTSYAGGIVGYMYTYSKLKKSANSGAVTAKKYVGGIVASSPMASHATKRNTITYCTNSAVVTGTTYAGGICGYTAYTDVTYNNNGGNVNGTTSTLVGGIAGQNTEHSTLSYNLNTGTLVSSTVAENALFGTSSTGTATENYYDNQRTKPISANGQNTLNLIGSAPTALTAEGWAENFIFNENMYPMPKGTQNYNEAKLSATPIEFNETEVYDSVLNNVTLGTENSVSWASGDEDHVATSGAVTLKCSEPADIELTASLADEDLTLNKIVTLKLAKVKVLPVSEMTSFTPYYVWTGVESSYDWGTPDNWLQYDGSKYNYVDASPSDNSNVVLIPVDESVCEFVSPVLAGDKTLDNVLVADGFALNMGDNLLTLAGNSTINGSIIGNVLFENTSTLNDESTGYIDGRITKRGAGTFNFITGHNDLDRGVLLKSAFGMTVAGDDAEVSVHYTTNHNTYAMPDSYSHGGNMSEGLDHVSDRDFWHVTTNKALSDVTLYWRDRDNLSPSELCDLEFLTVAYVTSGGSVWTKVDGEIGNESTCMVGSIKIDGLGVSRSAEQAYDMTFGSTDEQKLVLPIELVLFTASCNGNSVDVKWTTASEKNNDYFILERSYDAVNFTEIARIAGAGTSIEEHNYAFVDYEYYGGEMYYRLKQVDYDGQSSMSEMIAVRCDESDLEPAVAVFPNPFRSELTLSLSNFGNKPATIEVYDIMGVLVMTKDIDATGNNYETVLNLGNLSAATYTIRVSTADFVINRRVVKQ